MKLLSCSITALTLARLSHGIDFANITQLQALNQSQDAMAATVFALVYGAPLLEFSKVAVGPRAVLTTKGTNHFFTTGQLSTPSDTLVVAPNADTLYDIAIFDLAEQDLALQIPPMEADRFYLFAFYDPYGDQFETLGSVTADQQGEYLLSASPGTECSSYKKCIKSPTLNGILLIRVEAKNNKTDIPYIASYLSQCTLNATNSRNPLGPVLQASDFADISTNMTMGILQLTAKLYERNPPANPTLGVLVPTIFKIAGISSGNYTPAAGVDLGEAWSQAQLLIEASGESAITPLNNGWAQTGVQLAGNFSNGVAIPLRSFIANQGYLQNAAEQAIYPFYGGEALSSFDISDQEAVLYTFSRKPPYTNGFWSLTMQNQEHFLVNNSQGVYAIGDRSNITYADGKLVYADEGDDQPFQVLVQPDGVFPPTNWTKNWLPAPSGGGNFTVLFRIYAPKEQAINGSYLYPLVTQISAITA